MSETNRCRRGPRCPDAVRCDQGELHGAPADRALCDRCERAVANALTDVATLYMDLENALLPGAAPTSNNGKRIKAAGSPLGVNGRALHLQETVHQLLTVWEDAVRDTANLTAVVRRDEDPWERTKRRARSGHETVAASRLLSAHLTAWIVHGPVEYAVSQATVDPDDPKATPTDEPIYVVQAGWEAAVALLNWKHQVRATLGVTNPPIRRGEPCMYCKLYALVEVNGEDQIRCESCNRTWTRDEYRTKVRGFEPYLRKLAKELKIRAS